MRVVKVAGSQFEISATETELSILCNCLNEVCNGIHIFEFETRLGATMEDVLSMLDTLLATLRAAPDGTNT
jgi:hypothetical protein